MKELVLLLVISLFLVGCQGVPEPVVLEVPTPGPIKPDIEYCSDINDDGIVDGNDMKIMASEWGKRQTNDKRFRSDFNNDGIVDLKDLAVMADHWLGEK